MSNCRLTIVDVRFKSGRLRGRVFPPARGRRKSAMLRIDKGVDGFEPPKPAEVAVSSDDLGNAVFEAQGNNVCVVNRLAPIHEVEQGVAVKQVSPGQFRRFPAPQPQLIAPLGTSTQGATKKVIGHRLEGAAFFGSLSLQFAKKLVVDRQSGSCHMQKHTTYACKMSKGRG